jgi:hypothetical protein
MNAIMRREGMQRGDGHIIRLSHTDAHAKVWVMIESDNGQRYESDPDGPYIVVSGSRLVIELVEE